MIAVNEAIRPGLEGKTGEVYGYTTMNSAKAKKDQCSWICHNSTDYCKEHHVKVLKPYYSYTDQIYNGIINLLHSTGNYGLANIVFLVLLIPFLICLFITKTIQYNLKRRTLIRNK
jgi:hypothetical protein